MQVTELLHNKPPFIPQDSNGMIQVIELPPGDAGAGAHRHSGPVFGTYSKVKVLFELEGDEPYPIKAGEAFFEPGGDVIHYQAANLCSDRTSRFVFRALLVPDTGWQ